MNDLLSTVHIKVNEGIYLKDPDSSELGKGIVSEGLLLIDEIGLEKTTFKKLAQRLGTTEASIYRYFESKFKLLVYLTSWYWGWLEYQLVFSITNILDPEKKLRIAIDVLSQLNEKKESGSHINFTVLTRVVVSESSKAYLTKDVDEANKEGFYAGYKRVVQRVSDVMLEIQPEFEFSHTLSSTVMEGIHHQKYFAQHLPSLTDTTEKPSQMSQFYGDMVLATLKSNK